MTDKKKEEKKEITNTVLEVQDLYQTIGSFFIPQINPKSK